jgi:hypothetical protein
MGGKDERSTAIETLPCIFLQIKTSQGRRICICVSEVKKEEKNLRQSTQKNKTYHISGSTAI